MALIAAARNSPSARLSRTQKITIYTNSILSLLAVLYGIYLFGRSERPFALFESFWGPSYQNESTDTSSLQNSVTFPSSKTEAKRSVFSCRETVSRFESFGFLLFCFYGISVCRLPYSLLVFVATLYRKCWNKNSR